MLPVLLLGDCLHWIQKLKPQSVDLVLADLPYGKVKRLDIDEMLPLSPMWECFHHVLKPSGVGVFTCVQPFTSMLVMSNPKEFRYEMIWRKHHGGFLNANRQPLRVHQNILVFSQRQPKYNPQFREGVPYTVRRKGKPHKRSFYGNHYPPDTENSGTRYPTSIITSIEHPNRQVHPFQKTLELSEYLVKTFSDEGDTVLDPTAGYMSFGVACVRLRRQYVGIEKSPEWFLKGRDRVLAEFETRRVNGNGHRLY